MELDARTRNDVVLCMEFMPDAELAAWNITAPASFQPQLVRTTSNASSSGTSSMSTMWMGTDSEDGQ